MTLAEHHYTMLHTDRAIDAAIIRERGYRTWTTPDEPRAQDFSEPQSRTVPALGIPLWNVHRAQAGWQIRPDTPRFTAQGKPRKYENRPLPDGRLLLDVHPRMVPLLRDRREPLFITEGVPKADALSSCDVCTIALSGVWGFRGTNEHGGKVILPDWEHVPLNGREVIVVYDNDVMAKEQVAAALKALMTFLMYRQARPGVVRWPETLRHEKVGVDDFLAQGHTLTDLLALVVSTQPGPAAQPTRQGAPPPPPVTDPAADLGTVTPCSHTANARRLVRLYTPTLRYVLGEGWILWTGTFWRPDPTTDNSLATGFVSKLARSIAEEAAALYTAAAQQASDAARKALYALAEARGQWAAHSENATVIAGGLKLAKHDLLLDHTKINQNPWLFNCQNGTIDLKTGTFRAHDPADLITHLAPVAYDPKATCPNWMTFLREVFDEDMEMVTFLQRAFGSVLTGIVQDRALFFLYGLQGHNGKTTLVEAIRDVLGTAGEESFGYARKVDVTTFMKSKNYDDNLRKTAQLTGARFVYSSEIDEEHRLNEQLIKDMTGGDTLEARRLYREAFTFKPTFKPWMYGNHKPEIRGTDDALWSRVQLIEFPVSFANRVNPKLPEELRKELSGILNWMLQGCYIWQRIGLLPPAKVQAATAAYRKEQDTIGQFIRERCQTGKEYMQCKASRLYTAYRSWTEHTGHADLGQKRFGTYLTAHGYPSDDNATGRGAYRKRLALSDPPTGEGEEDLDDSATLPATLRKTRVASGNANNGAAKPQFGEQDATLATLNSRKSPIENSHEGLPGKKGSKGSNQYGNSPYPIEKTKDSSATLAQAKGSTPLHTLPCPHFERRAERFPDGSMLERCMVCHRIMQCTSPAE